MSKLIVFVTCQRAGSSISSEIFYQHGMSLGSFDMFGASPENPRGFCEAMPIFHINHELHQIVYGFKEDAIPYVEAGRIMKERNDIPLDIKALTTEIIDRGIETINRLTDGVSIAGFKHPATVLFWTYWHHVFSQFPHLEIIPVFLSRPPTGIAASYARRAKRPQVQNNMFDLIEVYLKRMRSIYDSWNSNKPIIRFIDEYYKDDLKVAIENCGLVWNEEIFERCYKPSVTVRVVDPIDHPVQVLYDQFSTRTPVSSPTVTGIAK